MSTVAKLPQLGYTPNRFTFHNGAPKPYDVRWAGLQFTVPAVDVVGTKPATFEDGTPIPGTYVVEDTWGLNRDSEIPTKDSPPNILAFEIVKNVLGVDPVTGKTLGIAARSGLSYLPANPTHEQVEAVREEGKRRYAESMVQWADLTVQGYLAAVDKCRSLSIPPPPAGEDYRRARIILEQHEVEVEATLRERGVGSEDDELEFLALAKVKAMELATKMAANKPELNKEQLAEALASDPEFLNMLRKKGLRIRKVGHLDPEETAGE
jgi:hypothetical protein